MTHCCGFWIGQALGPVERACLRSVLRQGHTLSLYCYSRLEGVPAGVEVKDAAEIVSRESIFLHARGSVAPFADLFRYELQRRRRGTWIDCDMYLVAPVPDGVDYIMGIQDESGTISNAILRLPPDCPVLAPLIALFDGKDVPPWLNRRERAKAYLSLLRRGRVAVGTMPWGTSGPRGLTALARTHGLSHLAQPRDVFYPMPWQQAEWILDPDIQLDQVLSPRTIGIHLYNEMIKDAKAQPAPPGSFLERLQREGSAAD